MKATSPLSAGPPDDDIGRGEDGGTHGHDGEAEVVQRHGPGLHQLPHLYSTVQYSIVQVSTNCPTNTGNTFAPSDEEMMKAALT